VFVAQEGGRHLGPLPERAAISVITTAELHLGVLMADDPAIRAQRLRTLTGVQNLFEPIPIDAAVAEAFAELAAEARREGRRPRIMDTWIAATAVVLGIPVYTQDEGFRNIPRVHVAIV
jgi:predicted nucleic acid-binding protein